MASKYCVSCLRSIQRQSRSIAQTRAVPSRGTASRAFTTTAARNIILPEPNASPAVSIPPVTPARAEGGHKTSPSSEDIKKMTRGIQGTYTAYGTTEILYQECASQADYMMKQAADEDVEVLKTEDGVDLGVGNTWWHTDLGLKPTFATWSQVTMLHMYLLSARFRALTSPDHQKQYQQHLLDHFSYDAENRMTVNHNMHARGTRNKYLKDLFVQWRGLLAAYDEGLVKGDAVLAAAVWRNVFKADEDVDIKGLAMVISYMRRTLKGLDRLPDDQIIIGEVGFGSPKAEEAIVNIRSPMLDLPFEKAPGAPAAPVKAVPAKKSK